MNSFRLKSNIFNALLLMVILVVPAIAGDSSQLINGDFNASSRKERLEIAVDVRNTVTNFLQWVPIPKPSEVEWVNSERAAIGKIADSETQTSHLVKLSESPEFQQVQLRANLQQIIKALDIIITPNISLQKEMLNWCITSHGLTNNAKMNDAVAILIRAGRLPEDFAFKVKLGQAIGYTGVLGWWGRGIQEYLVIQFLAGNIRK